MQTEATKKLFTVDEYYRMDEVGILAEDVRTELINGEIIEISPMGPRHAASVSRINHLLFPLFAGNAVLRIQLPLRLNDYNEPQPDLSFVKVRRDFYELRHPGPADVFSILEISDTSLRYDRDVKMGVYASSRIPEFWVLDLVGRALLVFREPSRGEYKTSLKFQPGDSVSMLAFSEIKIAVSDLLGAASE